MGVPEYTISHLGESAISLSFSNTISAEINDLVIRIAFEVENRPFPGLIECLPAYSSVTVFYDLTRLDQFLAKQATGSEIVASYLREIVDGIESTPATKTRMIEIPVSFDEEFALDLDIVSEHNRLENEEVIDIFLSKTYRVFMVGFLPGFAYMGEVDGKIATPRKSTPRLQVPQGSVGIAGSQTGIYPFESPGGWQIIGRTFQTMFDSNSDDPSFLKPGDFVKFVKS